MNLYIIRHAEPDYSIDSLTEKGWREAELLSRRLCKISNPHCYVSPLGRAKDTASLTLKKLGVEAKEMPWLQEFYGSYRLPKEFHKDGLGWDLLPEQWAQDPTYYDPANWFRAPAYRDTTIKPAYDAVCAGLDALLAENGYVRDGNLYRAEEANTDNVFLFCHYGVECVLLSHLMGCSPVSLWHHSAALPSSVTVLSTEERRPGTAIFRMSRFGDLSHLDSAGEAPSFAVRFCEVYGDGTRID